MFHSNQEYFEAVEAFIDSLKKSDHGSEAETLHDGFSCVNGLTDGWALLLESLLRIESKDSATLSDEQRKKLTILCDAAYKAVYRKERRSFWRSVRLLKNRLLGRGVAPYP